MIRKATLQDTPRAVVMLCAFVQSCRPQYGDAVDLFGKDHALRLFHSHLHPDAFAIVLADKNDLAQGLLLAMATAPLIAPVWVSKESSWWVEPSCRGKEAFRMLDQYEAWAVSRGCKLIGMSGMAGDERIASLYRRKGYHLAEQNFLKVA